MTTTTLQPTDAPASKRRPRRSSFLRYGDALGYIAGRPLCMMEEVEQDLAVERSFKRPKKALVAALESKLAEMKQRRATLARFDMMLFRGPMPMEQVFECLDAGETFLFLREDHESASPISREELNAKLAAWPAGELVKIYAHEKFGTVWIGYGTKGVRS